MVLTKGLTLTTFAQERPTLSLGEEAEEKRLVAPGGAIGRKFKESSEGKVI